MEAAEEAGLEATGEELVETKRSDLGDASPRGTTRGSEGKEDLEDEEVGSSSSALKERVGTRFSLGELENLDASASGRDRVSSEELLRFVFPAGLQHPLSTGRLYAFGFYGPLDREARLRSGHKGQHVVSRWELDAMCKQFEREDVLQVYILPGRPLASLSEAQQDELIAQADRRIKAPTGKGLMPQLSRSDVEAIFDGVQKAHDGSMNFHDLQGAIMRFRDDRVQKLKVMYPKLTRKKPQANANANKTGFQVHAGESNLTASSSQTRGSRRGPRLVSADVAPPEMFLKNRGMTNNGVSTYANKLLSTRAYKVCEIESGNSAQLAANVRLIREERKSRHLADPWTSKSNHIVDHKAKLNLINTLRHGPRAD